MKPFAKLNIKFPYTELAENLIPGDDNKAIYNLSYDSKKLLDPNSEAYKQFINQGMKPEDKAEVLKKYNATFTSSMLADKDLRRFYRNLLPKELLELEIPKVGIIVISDGSNVAYHVDEFRKVAINFYLHTYGEETVFKSTKNQFYFDAYTKGDGRGIFADNKFQAAWDLESLEELGRYQAKDLDCYMIDATKLHGVLNVTDKRRVMITLGFKDYDFEFIYNFLKEKNFIEEV